MTPLIVCPTSLKVKNKSSCVLGPNDVITTKIKQFGLCFIKRHENLRIKFLLVQKHFCENSILVIFDVLSAKVSCNCQKTIRYM